MLGAQSLLRIPAVSAAALRLVKPVIGGSVNTVASATGHVG